VSKRSDIAAASIIRSRHCRTPPDDATYLASHGTDQESALHIAMELTPPIEDPSLRVADYILPLVDRFRAGVARRVNPVA
jgi:hypothetical protein